MLGKMVKVIVDRPLGSYHPEHKDMYYPVNYGYIEGILAGDGEEQDAYILVIDVLFHNKNFRPGFQNFIKLRSG